MGCVLPQAVGNDASKALCTRCVKGRVFSSRTHTRKWNFYAPR